MLMCNNVILIGNLGRDPELRYTQSGKAVTNFDIAVNRQGREEVDWISIVCWEKLAEAVCQYCTKGQRLLVEGSLQTRQYETNSGEKRKVVEVLARAIRFGERPESGQDQRQEKQRQAQRQQDDFTDLGASDGDFPF